MTLAYIDTFMVLAIAASIMFLLSFIVRKNDPKAGGGVAGGLAAGSYRARLLNDQNHYNRSRIRQRRGGYRRHTCAAAWLEIVGRVAHHRDRPHHGLRLPGRGGA